MPILLKNSEHYNILALPYTIRVMCILKAGLDTASRLKVIRTNGTSPNLPDVKPCLSRPGEGVARCCLAAAHFLEKYVGFVTLTMWYCRMYYWCP